jgi:hypothetical protein
MKLTPQMLSDSRWHEIIISKSASSGLTQEFRNAFIKSICKHNVLLAARCKTNSHKPEPYLENIIASDAIKIAKTSPKPQESAIGYQALIEIGRFQEISDALKTSTRDSAFNIGIVANFVAQASENHTIVFLKTLLEVNFWLFIRAIDRIYQIEREFSFETKLQVLELINNNVGKFNQPVLVKLAATFKVILTNNISGQQLVDVAFSNNLIAYAIDIINLYNLHNSFFYEAYIEKIFCEAKNRNGLQRFIGYVKERGKAIDLKWLLILARNANPVIKNVALTYIINKPEHFNESIKAVIQENLALNMVSSIQYSYELIVKYSYQFEFPLKDIIDQLILLSTSISLELAYKILEDAGISNTEYTDIIINKLLAKDDAASIKKAVQLIEQYDRNYKARLLDIAITIKNRDRKLAKTAKDIVLKYISPCNSVSELSIGDIIYAVLLSYFKGDVSNGYSVQVGSLPKQCFVPYEDKSRRLKSLSIIQVKIVNIAEETQKIQLEIIDSQVEAGRLQIAKALRVKEVRNGKGNNEPVQKPIVGTTVECTITAHAKGQVFLSIQPSRRIGIISEKEILKIVATLEEAKIGLVIKAFIYGQGFKDRFLLKSPRP